MAAVVRAQFLRVCLMIPHWRQRLGETKMRAGKTAKSALAS